MLARSCSQERNHLGVRQLAEEALQHMVAPELMRAAVTCDYMCECLGFLRTHFDIDDPDPAVTVSVLTAFTTRMQRLFIDGFILADSTTVLDNGQSQKTASQMVFEEVQSPEPPFGLANKYYFQISVICHLIHAMCTDKGEVHRLRAKPKDILR